MKLLISLVALFSVAAFAVDPAAAPDAAAKDKVTDTQSTGGALKVQKTPAEIEGLTPPKEGKGKKKSKKATLPAVPAETK